MMKETLFNQQSQTTKLLQLLTLFMMLLAPKGAWSQVVFDGGDGSQEYPYTISTSDQLKAFAQAVNAGTQVTENLYFRIADLMQTPTIDCSNLNGTFVPIGTSDHPFKGTFDGNGSNLSIAYLTVSVENTDGCNGLFGVVDGGTITNVTLHTCSFNGGANVGAIVGELINGSVTNCQVIHCTLTSGDARSVTAGGIVGLVSKGTISNCKVNGATTLSASSNYTDDKQTVCYSFAGGIAGWVYNASGNAVTISSCEVDGATIKSTHAQPRNIYAGGIVGYLGGVGDFTIENNKVKGNTAISCINNTGSGLCYSGAITGRCVSFVENHVFSNNFYEYSVTVDDKTGYDQRAQADDLDENNDTYTYDLVTNNGAVLYTKLLSIGDIGAECEEYYYPLSDYEEGILAFAPGQTINISLNPQEGYYVSSASLVYTQEGASSPTTVPLENIDERPGYYEYEFEMPDVDATLSVNYGINVGGVAVTNINANNILGGDFALASYNKSTNTLTLNGCQFFIEAGDAAGRGFVEIGSEIKKLNVHLLGYNVISDNFGYLFKADNEESACTVNVTTGAIPGKLVYSGDHLTSNVTLNYGNSGLTWNDKVELKAIEYAQGTEDICYFGTGQFHDDGGSLFDDDYPYWDYSGFSGELVYYTNAETTNFDSNLSPTVLSELVEGQYVSKMRTDGSYLIGSLTFQCVPVSSEAAITVKLMSLDGETEFATGTLTDGVVTLKPNPSGLASFDNTCLTFSSTAPFSFVPMAVKRESIFEFHEGWATYYNADVDVQLPYNVAAYIVTEVGEETATLTQIKYVPKMVPVLLHQQEVDETDNTDTSNNMLVHTDKDVDDTSDLPGTVYGLYNGSLMRVTGTIPAGKNCLFIPDGSTSAPQLTFVFENDENMTGISDAVRVNDNRQSDEWYTLDGQKLLQKPVRKGFYIKNGKKVVINK